MLCVKDNQSAFVRFEIHVTFEQVLTYDFSFSQNVTNSIIELILMTVNLSEKEFNS